MNKLVKNVLFLGNTPTKDPRSVGGATIYTQYILDELTKDKSLKVKVVRTRNRWYKFGQLIDFSLLLLKLPFYFKSRQVVSIHASWDFHLTIGPFIYLVCKVFNKKMIYHFFGGNFHKQFQNYNSLIRWWLKCTILRSSFKLMETRKMVTYFQSVEGVSNIVWFPNARKSHPIKELNFRYSHRFVFISRVTKTKGIDLLFEVAEQLPQHFVVDVFGPLDERYYKEDSFKRTKLNYLGLLKPEEVANILLDYNVVVLPSFYSGEGYPGILIEALSLGKPIITTKLNALDEIVDSGYNGQLVEQQNVDDLYKAMLQFNKDNYKTYSLNAKKKFQQFDIENVINKLKKLY
jgi:glycosyltransferase involved in cell wall biosynthesis